MEVFHARIGEWLAANPISGVEAEDPGDGRGARAVLPKGTQVPDLTAWGSQMDAERAVAKEAVANRRAALIALRDGTGDLTARQITAILRILAREVLGS